MSVSQSVKVHDTAIGHPVGRNLGRSDDKADSYDSNNIHDLN